jgi:hypothetical protein
MFGRGICEKYQSRDEKFPEPKVEGNLVSRLVFFANTPPKHDKLEVSIVDLMVTNAALLAMRCEAEPVK